MDRNGASAGRHAFNRSQWEAATEKVGNLYANNGYIYAQVVPQEVRRTAPDGKPVVDLGWTIREGSPATINKIEIVGNDVTHERVIREAIVMLPGDLFSRDRLIRSYQNVSNLNFFQQPLPAPDVKPSENGVDVDIVFRVEEKRTGNINFGASLGQGTGVGGFLGLEEPNLFGRGKRGTLQWQFGKNINDFTLSYTDPNIKESRISGTVSLFDSRARYTVGDLGRRKQTGGALRLGFPFFGSRYTRLFTSYSYQRITYSEGSEDLRDRYSCTSCVRSTLGSSVLRDTRFGLPFATGGSLMQVSGELNGGILGGQAITKKWTWKGAGTRPWAPWAGVGSSAAGYSSCLDSLQNPASSSGMPARSSRSCIRWAGCSSASRSAVMTSSPSRRTGSTRRRAATRRARTRSGNRSPRSRWRQGPGSASRSTSIRSSMPETSIVRPGSGTPPGSSGARASGRR